MVANINKYFYLLILIIFLSSPFSLKASNNFESFVLKNGLTVYVLENKNIPIVVHSVFYKVGGIDEPNSKSGIAHLLEHLMFKGTKKYSGDEFLKTIKVSGGLFNAFTSHDYTGYYEVIPKNVLPKIMAMEADRMTNISITQEMLEVEKKIVTEEKLLRIDTNVNSKFFQDYRAVFFKSSPYSRPVIGWTSDFESITLQDVVDFYKTYYSPQNAIVVITGNVNLKEVKKLSAKYYAKVPVGGNKINKIKPIEENLLNNNTYIHVNKESKQPLMVRSYLVDVLANSKDSIKPLQYKLLSYMLSAKSGKLYKHLVNDTKLAVDVSVSYNPFARGNTMFTIVVVPNKGVNLYDINKSLNEFINTLSEEGFTDEEFLMYVNKFRNEFTYLKDNPQQHLFFMANIFVNEIDLLHAKKYENISMYLTKENLQNTLKEMFSTPYLNGFLVQNKDILKTQATTLNN